MPTRYYPTGIVLLVVGTSTPLPALGGSNGIYARLEDLAALASREGTGDTEAAQSYRLSAHDEVRRIIAIAVLTEQIRTLPA